MSAQTLLEVLLKFWGVVILASTLTPIPSLFYVLPGSTPEFTRAQVLVIAAGVATNATVGACLLLLARTLSQFIMPGADSTRIEWPAGGLLEVALVALGIFLMVGGLKLAVIVGVELLRAQTWVKAGLQESAWEHQRSNFASGATELLAGYLVLRFRRRISQWLPGGSEGAA